MTIIRSIVLFVVAALAEIGGAWLIWQGVREHKGLVWIGAGIAALGAYGFVATFQPDPNFGRILAAYGGIFVAGSLASGVVIDKFRPDRYDLAGAAICLLGVGADLDGVAGEVAQPAGGHLGAAGVVHADEQDAGLAHRMFLLSQRRKHRRTGTTASVHSPATCSSLGTPDAAPL